VLRADFGSDLGQHQGPALVGFEADPWGEPKRFVAAWTKKGSSG
jgi:hypothetical protein